MGSEELGGNMPETLPTPEKFIRELEKEELEPIHRNLNFKKLKR